MKVVSSLTSFHYLWRSLGPFSLPSGRKTPIIITIIITHISIFLCLILCTNCYYCYLIIFQTKGELSSERKEKYEVALQTFQKLQVNANTFAVSKILTEMIKMISHLLLLLFICGITSNACYFFTGPAG